MATLRPKLAISDEDSIHPHAVRMPYIWTILDSRFALSEMWSRQSVLGAIDSMAGRLSGAERLRVVSSDPPAPNIESASVAHDSALAGERIHIGGTDHDDGTSGVVSRVESWGSEGIFDVGRPIRTATERNLLLLIDGFSHET